MTPSIVLITGGNTGLGFETVKSLYNSSKLYTILLGGRNIDKANTAVHEIHAQFPDSTNTVTAVQIDIEDDDSISKLFESIKNDYGRIDVLINNAGASFDSLYIQGKMTMRETWNKSYSLNTTSTQILTHTLIPLLLSSSSPRLLLITSGTATLTEHDNTALAINKSPEPGWPKTPGFSVPAYRSSKTGMNMMMREWHRVLKNDGVKVWCISPGLLATGLGGNPEMLKKMGAEDPAMGANFVRDVVEGKHNEDVGKAIRRNGVQSW